MLRLTLGGPGLDGFPAGQAGGYVKLRLPQADGKIAVRTYTIRAQRGGENGDASGQQIDVDFALHAKSDDEADGPATEWATRTHASNGQGDQIEVGGPGPAKPLPPGHDFYLLVGDMTALPAISVNLEMLPDDARGLAIIEVLSADDKQDLACPAGVEIRWIVNPHPGRDVVLPAAVQVTPWPDGNVYAWCASEFSTMQALRRYLREERGLGPAQLYISSYWKSGLTEEAHKDIKREDLEATAG